MDSEELLEFQIKKNLEHYVIEYDHSIHEDDDVVVQYTTYLFNTKKNQTFAQSSIC